MLPPRRRRRLRERRSVQVIAVLLAAALVWLSWSVGSALTTPRRRQRGPARWRNGPATITWAQW